MHSFFIFVLFFGTAVLAKGGVSSSSSSGGRSSASSGSDAELSWSPYLLFQLILAIALGVFTLFGGGYWLIKRYNPAARAAGSTLLLWTTWINWGFSIAFYTFAAISAAVFAQVRGGNADLNQLLVAWVSPAFENLATGGWMIILLGHAYRLWRTSNVEVKHPRRTCFLFYFAFALLVSSALLGGIVAPAMIYIWGGSGFVPNNVQVATNLLGASMRRAEGFKTFDPLRWIVFIILPIWWATALTRVILVIVGDQADHPVLEAFVHGQVLFLNGPIPCHVWNSRVSPRLQRYHLQVVDVKRSKEIDV
ncbi:hypothetical protein DL96DRAFT_1614702 [Flagelloscypha sp. PMI_526]|nr:hypothetical protein DL96DRAFT_1614702 [Flagelloscypha sp. PMI_526]